jgi:hypothetical protein
VTRASTVLGTMVVLGALLAVLGVAQWAGRDRAAFAPGSTAAVERAVDAAGLEICDVTDAPDGLAPAGVGGRAYEVAASCPGDAVTVVVSTFTSAGDRDGAARQFESQARPRSSGAVFTLADATVLLQGSGDGDARRRLGEALRLEGAR